MDQALRAASQSPYARPMHAPPFLIFASDATLAGLAGGAFLLLSLVAHLGERRRLRRKAIDAVGWMPWSTVSAAAMMPGAILLLLALKGWVAG